MLIFSEVLNMKTFLKHLLVLALMVLVFSGCQNPSGPETPEDLTKVEFRWCSYLKEGYSSSGDNYDNFCVTYPAYLLDLHIESNNYVYGCPEFDKYPEGYGELDYTDLCMKEDLFKKFSEDVFEKFFGTKYYKQGEKINLEKWIVPARNLLYKDEMIYTQLYFLAEDVKSPISDGYPKNDFTEINVGNEDIVVYIYWKYGTQTKEVM